MVTTTAMSNAKSYTEEWKRAGDVGSGGQAVIQKVHRLQDENNIAVAKILNKQNDEGRRARMHRESTALQTLSYKNIALFIASNTYYFKNLSYRLFIITKYIRGDTLEEYKILPPLAKWKK